MYVHLLGVYNHKAGFYVGTMQGWLPISQALCKLVPQNIHNHIGYRMFFTVIFTATQTVSQFYYASLGKTRSLIIQMFSGPEALIFMSACPPVLTRAGHGQQDRSHSLTGYRFHATEPDQIHLINAPMLRSPAWFYTSNSLSTKRPA